MSNYHVPSGYRMIPWMEPSMLRRSWSEALHEEFDKDYFIELNKFLAFERALNTPDPIFPLHEKVFAWSQYCNIEDVKVVILGQDPSPRSGVACGLSFSSEYPNPPPESLKLIFEEMQRDIGFIPPKHGDLRMWALRGVLLLNSLLTVEKGKPGEHWGKGWHYFTDAVIRCINEKCENVVFMLWGTDARKKRVHIDRLRHHVLEAMHPRVPYDSPRTDNFKGSKHFSKANKYMESKGKPNIDWSIA